MLDDNITDDNMKAQVLSLMYVLYEYGIKDVHMGGLMRILGIDNEVAVEFDDKVFALDDEFAKYMTNIQLGRNSSQPLH